MKEMGEKFVFDLPVWKCGEARKNFYVGGRKKGEEITVETKQN